MQKTKTELTVTAGAAIIDQKADQWQRNGRGSLSALIVREANKLSNDPVFNAAAWMRYSCGASLDGETDADWLQSARDLQRIFAAGK